MKKIIQVFVAIVLLATIIPFVCATKVETEQVYKNTTGSWTFDLREGERFKGAISITGGTRNDLVVWITDPIGATVLNLGVVRQGDTMEFTAYQSGAYRLNMDNGGDAIADGDKMVSISFDIESNLLNSVLVLIVTIIVFIIVGAILVVYYISKKRKTPKLVNPTPPS